ncbi:MAG: RNA polymerase sigma factor [Bacteroidota bacterium]
MNQQDLLLALRDPGRRERAFTQLVREYGPLLHRHLSRMLPAASDVDDVLQNTLVKAFRNLERFRGDSKLTTWLYRIATNEALSWLRSSKRRSSRVTATDVSELHHNQPVADPYFDGDAAQAELRKAIASLPDKQKAVFVFRYYEELSYQEISEITGTSQGALKASYHLAVKKIEQKLRAYVK